MTMNRYNTIMQDNLDINSFVAYMDFMKRKTLQKKVTTIKSTKL